MSSFNICMNNNNNKVHNVDPSSTANPIPIQDVQHNNNNKCQRLALVLIACLFVLVSITVVLAIGNLINYIIHVFTPPTLKDPTFDINSLTLSKLNVSSNPNQISANWNISLSITNRDKHGYFNFSGMTLAIYYNDIQVGVTGFQPIYINPVSPVMQFAKEFSGSSGYVNDSTISMMRNDIDAAGTVIYNVQFQSMIVKTYKKGRKNDHWHPYPWIVVCENVELNFGSDKSPQFQMLNTSYKCKLLSVRSYGFIDF